MRYNLFLDDIRSAKIVYPDKKDKDFVIVRDYNSFVETIKINGLPDFISFDNDLGLDEKGNIAPDGYACAKWLVYESQLNIVDLKFNVHSANPVAKIQIESLLNNYIKFIKKI